MLGVACPVGTRGQRVGTLDQRPIMGHRGKQTERMLCPPGQEVGFIYFVISSPARSFDVVRGALRGGSAGSGPSIEV